MLGCTLAVADRSADVPNTIGHVSWHSLRPPDFLSPPPQLPMVQKFSFLSFLPLCLLAAPRLIVGVRAAKVAQ